MRTDVRDALEAPTNPVKAIRAKCLDCSCGQYSEVEHCPVAKCPLFMWRFGKNPYRQKKILSEDSKRKMADRLSIARSKKMTM